MSDERQPWERMEGETDRAYAVFECYRDLDPSNRSLLETSRRMYPSVAQKSPDKQSIPGSVNTWSKEFEWQQRTKAWDEAKRKRDLEATQQQREKAIIKAWDALVVGIEGQAADLEDKKLDPETRNRTVNSLRATLAQLGFVQVVDDTTTEVNFTIRFDAPPDEPEPGE